MRKMIDIFIPSYHRADNCKSVRNLLERYNWNPTNITLFVDNEENENVNAYKQLQQQTGINLEIFDIEKARKKYDFIHRASPSRRAAGLCRNTFYEYAKEKGIKYYVVMDDDMNDYRYYSKKGYEHLIYNGYQINKTFMQVVEFMQKKHIGCFGLPQTGDYIGGTIKGIFINKVMNTTFYCTEFMNGGEAGVQDDDTTQFVNIHNRGLFTGSTGYGLTLMQTQSCTAKGGLTELYNECKLLNKALVTVIQFPSAIRAIHQPKNGGRIHHQITDKYIRPRLMKGKNGNIAWDKYAEDMPFTMKPFNNWRE